MIYRGNITIIFLPPIVISASLFWNFLRSLLLGRKPLITKIAECIYQEELSSEVKNYSYYCTIVWAVIMGLMTLETIFLAILAPLPVWSLFCNIINYIILGSIFIFEYLFRMKFIKSQKLSVTVYFCRLIKLNWMEILR